MLAYTFSPCVYIFSPILAETRHQNVMARKGVIAKASSHRLNPFCIDLRDFAERYSPKNRQTERIPIVFCDAHAQSMLAKIAERPPRGFRWAVERTHGLIGISRRSSWEPPKKSFGRGMSFCAAPLWSQRTPPVREKHFFLDQKEYKLPLWSAAWKTARSSSVKDWYPVAE